MVSVYNNFQHSPLMTFSIIIPAYNAGAFIQTTLQSVYNQIFSDIEIIVVNDGSTDDTAAVLERQTDSRLRVIHQTNAGVSAARNKAISEARGKYLAFLDADDVWTPDHLALAHLFLTRHPEFVWYCSAFERVTDITDDMLNDVPSREGLHFEARNWVLEIAETVAYANVVILRSAIIEERLFPEGIKMCEDTIAFMQIANRHPMIGFLESRTMWYRRWGNSACVQYWHSNERLSEESLYLSQFQSIAVQKNCKREVRLYVIRASLFTWWKRIRSKSMLPWVEEMRQRKPLHGVCLTAWLVFCAYLIDIFCKAMGKIVRLRYDAIDKKIKREAMSQRKKLSRINN